MGHLLRPGQGEALPPRPRFSAQGRPTSQASCLWPTRPRPQEDGVDSEQQRHPRDTRSRSIVGVCTAKNLFIGRLRSSFRSGAAYVPPTPLTCGSCARGRMHPSLARRCPSSAKYWPNSAEWGQSGRAHTQSVKLGGQHRSELGQTRPRSGTFGVNRDGIRATSERHVSGA